MSQHSSKQICQSQNVQAYFDNELDAPMYSLMREHVAECNVCRAELRSLGHLHALMGLAFGFTSDLTHALKRYSLASH